MTRLSSQATLNPLEQQCAVPARHHAPVCRAQKLVALRFRRTDPIAASKFFIDFGLTLVSQSENHALLRGASDQTACIILERGPAAYVGFSLAVASEDDLTRLAKTHNTPIVESDHGRGGKRVVLHDPDGVEVEALWNYARLPEFPLPPTPLENRVKLTPRVNTTVRIALDQPCTINKLGHTVLGVRRIAESIVWYQQNFGLIVSDFQLMENDPLPVVAFMRCDLGDLPADHHTLAVASAVETGHMHTAFEVNGLDSVAAGGEFLRRHKYRHTWGIGRHILGSQLFDYWRDPLGDMFEHYSDGDVFDSSVPAGYHPIHPESMHQWGPPLNADMAGKHPSLKLIRTIASRLRSNDDLSFKRLVNLIRSA
ncbi:MAG: VOC family protein [Rhodocyclaceae bacterium]|nr:VOC family protein [Rhodocyclaceae bacterium]MBL0076516.1 VOC family protein [Rhodocyclaceae bacterium]MBP6109605.1 VOC family protein [Rhodocyclaceae bacterium]MBP6280374.1 VOC family protein [Rhodocyclaceae bacterium]